LATSAAAASVCPTRISVFTKILSALFSRFLSLFWGFATDRPSEMRRKRARSARGGQPVPKPPKGGLLLDRLGLGQPRTHDLTRPARRDEGAYSTYVTEEQRRGTGCMGGPNLAGIVTGGTRHQDWRYHCPALRGPFSRDPPH
jgi:hypothetical protein